MVSSEGEEDGGLAAGQEVPGGLDEFEFADAPLGGTPTKDGSGAFKGRGRGKVSLKGSSEKVEGRGKEWDEPEEVHAVMFERLSINEAYCSLMT